MKPSWNQPRHEVGGKGYQLAWMARHGFPVPPFEVLTASIISEWVEFYTSDRQAWLDAVAMRPFPIEMIQFINSFCQPIFDTGDQIAVRSSVADEDAATTSFAGQMESVLYCQTQHDVETAIRHCVASAASDRVLAYRNHHQLPTDSIQIAVILQRMIDPEVSGVLFTANPATGNRKEMVVSATYGVGEGVVSGTCDTDQFVLDRDGRLLSQTLVTKSVCLGRGDQKSGAHPIPVDGPKQDQPCLSPSQLKTLGQTGRHIATLKGHPQDIEFAFIGDQLFLLQTRDVTALPPFRDGQRRRVWDNSNIEESYAGITTPLTFSFARKAYRIAYEGTATLMGVDAAQIQSLHREFDQLLGLIKGRVYYNINHWYLGITLLPAFSRNKADMERMMGLQDPVDFVKNERLPKWDMLKKIPSMVGLLSRFLIQFMKISTLTSAFIHRFEARYQEIDRRRLHELELTELLGLLDHLDQTFLKQWQTPIINDLFVMMTNGRLHRMIRAIDPSLEPMINHLLAGEPDIASTEPTKALIRIAESIRTSPAFLARLQTVPTHEWAAVFQVERPDLYQALQSYIDEYGDRCTGELKLESITFRQDPSFLFTLLNNLINQSDLTIQKLTHNEQALRQRAETELRNTIRKQGRWGGVRRFNQATRRLRLAIKNRENMRLKRTHLFGMYRDVYLQMGRQLALQGVLAADRDILYLTVDEIQDYFSGTAVQHDFASLVAIRKSEYNRYSAVSVAHHFETDTWIYHHTDYSYTGQKPVVDPSASTLTGIPCYPGRVTAQVQVIDNPQDIQSLNGDILCAVRTDPGWAPLFPTARGILVERGSTLSHSAVVARELGIPAVVGIHGITQRLKTGDWITLDGQTGTIIIHESNPNA